MALVLRVLPVCLVCRLWVASVMLIFCAQVTWILRGIHCWSTALPSSFCSFKQAWGPSLLLCWSQASLRRQSLKKPFCRTRRRHSEKSSPYPCITAELNFNHAIELDTFYYVQCACRPTSIRLQNLTTTTCTHTLSLKGREAIPGVLTDPIPVRGGWVH